MPGRIARSSVSTANPKNAKNKSRKRNLDAYSIAGHQIHPDKVAAHRLGESLDDHPRQKRRRTDEDEDEDASEGDSAPRWKLPRNHGRRIEEDDVDEGSDSEGNEWRMGGLREDDSDSDLDSDEAFGDSDEERFEGFTFRGSSTGQRNPKRKAQMGGSDEEGGIDLDEEEGSGDEDAEEEDDFGEEGVDLATMLDDDHESLHEASGSDEASESASEEDESAEEDFDDELDIGGEEGRIARLRDRVEAMDAEIQAAAPRSDLDEDGALTLDDLLGDDPATKREYAAPLKTKKKSQAPKTLTVPLPTRQQDRLDRQVASQKAMEQLDRWKDTVIHNRRAEFLTFPLVDPHASELAGKEKFVVDSQPRGALEENIRKIMEESGMVSKAHEKPEDVEQDIMKAEELGMNDIPVEEVLRRRAELRRMRELLFREEIKAKRIAKIKSKSYRRVHRKERERQAQLEGGETGLDEDEQEREDRRRAEARMSTKHKDSKFAKAMKATNRTVWDENARDGVRQQARRQEELRRRIAGEEVHDSDQSEVPSDDGDDEDDGDDDDDTRTLRQLNKLRDQGAGIGQKGVGGMKFMRAAEERQRARNDEDIERMRKDMAAADGDEASGDEVDDQGLGRAIFGPKGKQKVKPVAKAKKGEFEEGLVSDEEGVAERLDGDAADQTQDTPRERKPLGRPSGPLAKGNAIKDRRAPEAEDEAALSSWLTGPAPGKTRKSKQRNATEDAAAIVSTAEPALTESEPVLLDKMSSAKRKQAAARMLNGGAPNGNTDGWQTVPFSSGSKDDSHVGSDSEPDTTPLLSARDAKAALQRRAFAGDDVAKAFEAEKAADVESEDEKEVSTHLPGWGSWTGAGLSKSLKKANARAAHNPLYKRKLPGGTAAENRRDKGRKDLIISEKQDRKGKKYLAPVLPHGFESREQYERSLRLPMGGEWVTKEVQQRGTRPRVVVKKGTIIEPMERPLV